MPHVATFALAHFLHFRCYVQVHIDVKLCPLRVLHKRTAQQLNFFTVTSRYEYFYLISQQALR